MHVVQYGAAQQAYAGAHTVPKQPGTPTKSGTYRQRRPYCSACRGGCTGNLRLLVQPSSVGKLITPYPGTEDMAHLLCFLGKAVERH